MAAKMALPSCRMPPQRVKMAAAAPAGMMRLKTSASQALNSMFFFSLNFFFSTILTTI